jgi:transcription initiation factor TFIID subunit 11
MEGSANTSVPADGREAPPVVATAPPAVAAVPTGVPTKVKAEAVPTVTAVSTAGPTLAPTPADAVSRAEEDPAVAASTSRDAGLSVGGSLAKRKVEDVAVAASPPAKVPRTEGAASSKDAAAPIAAPQALASASRETFRGGEDRAAAAAGSAGAAPGAAGSVFVAEAAAKGTATGAEAVGNTGKESAAKGEGGEDGYYDDGEGDLDLSSLRQHEYEQVAKFTPSQLHRYEQYRRSDLKTAKIKKVLAAINPALAKSSDHFLVAVKGLAKVFVGDVVETALTVRNQCGDTGALQPKHLREAYRRMQRTGAVPSTSVRRGGLT